MSRVLEVLRSRAVKAGFLVVALALAVWAVVSQWDEVSAALVSMDPLLLVAALALGLVYVVLTMLSWRAVLADHGTPLPMSSAAPVFLVSQLGKYVPGGVWNIVAAAEMGADHRIPRRRSVSAMLVTLLISMVTGLMLAAISMPFSPPALADRFGWVLVLLPLFVIVLLPPVLGRIVALALRVTKGEPLERPLRWRGIGAAVGWQLLAWIVAGLQVWVLAVGVGMEADARSVLLCIGGYGFAWVVGFLVVVVPAGAGVRESILAIMLGASLSTGGVLAVVLLSRVVLTLADLLLGGLGLLLSRRARAARAAAAVGRTGPTEPTGPTGPTGADVR
ncbi:hypothetical protein GCM10009592_15400 [Brachybacterium rhamnosum]|uniref:Lysylphosphatidylglycerol synthase domain-containing protein n=1 Tax=Brachybacterium rhamnosum TaxID=173361 RepID=A0ABW4PY73_9MICO